MRNCPEVLAQAVDWGRGSMILAILGAGLVFAPILSGQGLTGQVSGTVRDSSGRPMPAAEVVITSEATGSTRKVTAAEDGGFVVAELLPGSFQLSIDAPGYSRHTMPHIAVPPNERVVLEPIVMSLGAVTEVIFVEASKTPLPTESAERSARIDSAQLKELSLKGRDYLGMLQLLPGVVDTAITAREAPGVSTLQGLYFNGNRQGTLNLTLDGISTMDTGGGTGPYFQPSIDAVSEVKVLLTNFQAEYGRTSGGTINTITKSGSREFHGGAYYFLRNEALNANDFFANVSGLRRARYRYLYPGYQVGGPVLFPKLGFNRDRDKLFFFWSQEFLSRQYPTSVSRQTFPTAAERLGDYSQTVDQNGQRTVIRDPAANTPFPGNTIPRSRIDSNGQALLNVFPLPNTFDPARSFNYVVQSGIEQPRRDQVLRVDWNITPGLQFYARGIKDLENKKGGFGYVLASPAWPQLPIDYEIRSAGFAATLIHTISPASVNAITFGVNRGVADVAPFSDALAQNSRGTLPQFFPASNPLKVVPNATFAGVPSAPQLNLDARFPYFGVNDVWVFSDNFSRMIGPHALKMGVYVDKSLKNQQLGTAFNGTFAFDRDPNNPFDTGHPFSNALAGSIASYSESSGHPVSRARELNVEWFLQDNWKVNRRLTADVGVRFYFIKPTLSSGTGLAAFQPGEYQASQQPPLVRPYIDPQTGRRLGRDPVTGQTLPAVKIGSFSPAAGTPNQGMRVYESAILETPPIQLAPRAGLAWDVFGNGRTAIRGGAGVFFDRFPGNQITQLVGSPPLVTTPFASYTTIADLLRTPLSLSPGNVFGVQTAYQPPAVYNWSFSIQQSIAQKTVLDVSYVGNVARHGMHIRNLNATAYGTNFLASSRDDTVAGNRPLPLNFLRPYRGFGDILYMEFASNSNYHALQAHLTRRMATSLTFSASYAWSKVLNVADTPSSVVNPVLDYRSRNYGPALFDRRQSLTVSLVYMVPRLSARLGVPSARHVLDGWEISSIGSFLSGAPAPINYSFVTAMDVTGAGGAGIDSRVDLSCEPNLPHGQRSSTRAFDTTCVRPPSAAGLGIGGASKYPFVGPGTQNLDISLFKNFRLPGNEARRLQFRFETYNTFNQAQFNAVDNNARFDGRGSQVNMNLGRYTGATPARRLALALKFYF